MSCRSFAYRFTRALRAALGLLALTALFLLPRPGEAQTTASDVSSAAIAPRNAASIILKVSNFEAARRSVTEAASVSGAMFAGGDSRVNDKGRHNGSLEFTLPAGRLPSFLTALRQIGSLYSERLSSRDETSEYQSLGRRIERLETHQKRLGGMLQDSHRLRGSDILYVQERLFRAETDESALRQNREDLQRAAQIARVSVTLFEPLPVTRAEQTRRDHGTAFYLAMGNARNAAGKLFGKAVTASAYIITFAPLWIPLVIATYFLYRQGRLWWRRLLAAYPRDASLPLDEKSLAPPAAS